MLHRLIVFGFILIVAVCVIIAFWPSTHRPASTTATTVAEVTTRTVRPAPLPKLLGGPPPAAPAGDCGRPETMRTAAADNAISLTTRAWSPWGRAETGWQIYAPLVAAEISTACDPSSAGFALALSRWQVLHKLPADGILTPQSFETMRVAWLKRRPFVQAFGKGSCPPAANPLELASADKAEGYSGKPIQLSIGALAAYRGLTAAARKEVPELAADPKLLTIFSGYRAPAEDEARCDKVGDCGTVARARCSAHRTGTALDLYLGAAPGSRPESTDDENRLYQSRTSAYRWLVQNGQRFGFVPYPFEPWHWEWTGQAAS